MPPSLSFISVAFSGSFQARIRTNFSGAIAGSKKNGDADTIEIAKVTHRLSTVVYRIDSFCRRCFSRIHSSVSVYVVL